MLLDRELGRENNVHVLNSHDYNTYEDDHSPSIGTNTRDTSDDNIKLILTERCLKAVLDHFADFECPPILSPIIYSKEYADYANLKIADKVKVYNLEMLEIQRKLLIQRLNRMDEAINVGDPIYPVPFL